MVDEPIVFSRPMTGNWAGQGFTAAQVRFDRAELNRILTVYGRMVAAGQWRDYAIDFKDDVAIFSVFRRTSEMPFYRIEKRPKLRQKQGQYMVIDAGGQILKRGHELENVLRVFDKKLLKALAST